MRKRLFQFGIAPDQSIIFLIRDQRRVVGMIELVVLCDYARKAHQLVCCFGFTDFHGSAFKPP